MTVNMKIKTVGELRNLIRDLPDNIEVVTLIGCGIAHYLLDCGVYIVEDSVELHVAVEDTSKLSICIDALIDEGRRCSEDEDDDEDENEFVEKFVSKDDRFAKKLTKFTPPFEFVRLEFAPFTCLCGGRGSEQIVIKDANGLEFSIGRSCAYNIPGMLNQIL